MFLCIKQQLSNIWSWIHENVQQNWGGDEKVLLTKKAWIHQQY